MHMTEVRNLLSGVNFTVSIVITHTNSTQHKLCGRFLRSETFHRKFANLVAELRNVSINNN